MGKIVWNKDGIHSYDDDGNETYEYAKIYRRIQNQLLNSMLDSILAPRGNRPLMSKQLDVVPLSRSLQKGQIVGFGFMAGATECYVLKVGRRYSWVAFAGSLIPTLVNNDDLFELRKEASNAHD